MIRISEKDFDTLLQRTMLAGRAAAGHGVTVAAHKALSFLLKDGEPMDTKAVANYCQCTQKTCVEALKTLAFAGLTEKVRGGKWRFCPADWMGSEIPLGGKL